MFLRLYAFFYLSEYFLSVIFLQPKGAVSRTAKRYMINLRKPATCFIQVALQSNFQIF